MTARIVNLWAHSQQDLESLKGALQKVFGNNAGEVTDLGPHVWRNSGLKGEDTYVGHTKALPHEEHNPTVRYIAEVEVEDDGSLSVKLAQVVALLPANNKDSFAIGNSINMGPPKLEVIEGGALKDEPLLVAFG